MIPIILASASPRRRALLNALGIDVEVRVSNAAETLEGTPREVVLSNAIDKRDAIAAQVSESAVVVAADTIVVLGDSIIGKPRDLDEARATLARLSGMTHEVVTGLAVVNTLTGGHAEDVETTSVTFCDLSSDDIDRFVEAVRPLDRAGAYTVDGPGSLLVVRYDGCYQNVLGLPIVLLDKLLQRLDDGLFQRLRPEAARFL